ncbi:hypothetical protein CER19_05705 [Pseudomonas sp. GL93]|nr:hypothetical protein CER19_05705 [Pseudomonas sp. GL93]
MITVSITSFCALRKAEIVLNDLRQPGEFAEYRLATRQTVACDQFLQEMNTTNGAGAEGCALPAYRLLPTEVCRGR